MSLIAADLLAKNLRRIRKARGMTREELAKAADLGSATVARIEKGEGTSLHACDDLARALGVTFNELFKAGR